jgi:hypothetical protein
VTDDNRVNYCFLTRVDKPDCDPHRSVENESNRTSRLTFAVARDAWHLRALLPRILQQTAARSFLHNRALLPSVWVFNGITPGGEMRLPVRSSRHSLRLSSIVGLRHPLLGFVQVLALLAATSCAPSPEDVGDEGRGGATAGHGGGAAGAGTTGAGGTVGAGGMSTGGSPASGGAGASGGTSATGGSTATGSGGAAGGTSAAGGAGATAGGGGAAGVPLGGRGGASGAGGQTSAGGRGGGGASSGGSAGAGGGAGASGGGGASGAAGMTGSAGPCDIYQAANTPCVAAHSTVRALYASYAGSLYQLRRASDKTVKDVPVLAPGGFVNISVHDSFCSGTTCTISIIYDQSPNKNDLAKSPVAYWLKNGGNEANAADGKAMVGGHVVHGIYVTGYSSNVAYRNNATKGVAKGDQAEAMYMVVDGKRFSDQCCFDYGNAETSGKDDGNGTMEAVYWGNDITWGGKGEGNGPWVAADLENGVFKSDKGGWQSQSLSVPNAKSVIATYATAMLKGPSGNHFTLKAGNAQSGTLTKMWDGVRPSPGYSPKKLQGAIILGTGGDGSNGGTGTFFEGAITLGTPPDATDDLIQANIVAAGYGR